MSEFIMFDIGSINIITQGNSVIIKNSKFCRQHIKVYNLGRWPNDPFCSIQSPSFGFNFFNDFFFTIRKKMEKEI